MPLTDPVPSSAFDVLERNIQDTDKFVNQETGVFTNRVGKQIKPIKVIESQAIEYIKKTNWNPVGLFSDGVTFEKISDFAIDDDGVQWIYTGTLPFTAIAGTTPSNPIYQSVKVSSLQQLANLTDPSDLAQRHRFRTTVTEIESGVFKLNDALEVVDRDNGPFIVVAGTPNGTTKINAGGGNVAIVQQVNGEISAEWCGCIGTSNHQSAAQDWVDYSASLNCKAVTNGIERINVTGLKLPTNTNLILGNTELFLLSGSNKPIVSNKDVSFTTRFNSNIRISANKPLNCNESGQTSNTTPTGELLSGVCFVGVDGLVIDFDILSPRRYAWWFINTVKVSSTKRINAQHTYGIYASNKDGFHINGNCHDFNIPWLNVNTGQDDILAINATDVNHGGDFTSENVSGPITDIEIGQLTGDDNYNGIRILSANPSDYIRNIKVGRVDIAVSRYPFNVESYGLGAGGRIDNVKVGDINWWVIDGSTDTFRGVWIDANDMSKCDIQIDRIKRTQFSNAVGSVSASTVYINHGSNTTISIGDIIEENCGNTEVIYIQQTLAPAFIKIGDLSFEGTSGGSKVVVKVNSSEVSYLKALSKLTIGDVTLGTISQVVSCVNATIGDITVGVPRASSQVPLTNIIKMVNSSAETFNMTKSALPALGNLVSGSKICDLDATSIIQSKGGMLGMSATGVSPALKPSVNDFMWSHKAGVTKMIFYRGDAWVDALGTVVTP